MTGKHRRAPHGGVNFVFEDEAETEALDAGAASLRIMDAGDPDVVVDSASGAGDNRGYRHEEKVERLTVKLEHFGERGQRREPHPPSEPDRALEGRRGVQRGEAGFFFGGEAEKEVLDQVDVWEGVAGGSSYLGTSTASPRNLGALGVVADSAAGARCSG